MKVWKERIFCRGDSKCKSFKVEILKGTKRRPVKLKHSEWGWESRQVGGVPEPAQAADESSLLNFQEYLESVVITLVVGNQPQWEYLHHENWQMLPQGFLLGTVRHTCIFGVGERIRGGTCTEQIKFKKWDNYLNSPDLTLKGCYQNRISWFT